MLPVSRLLAESLQTREATPVVEKYVLESFVMIITWWCNITEDVKSGESVRNRTIERALGPICGGLLASIWIQTRGRVLRPSAPALMFTFYSRGWPARLRSCTGNHKGIAQRDDVCLP